MLIKRSLRVSHIPFKGNPHVTKERETTIRALQQDGHRIWGPVLYRSTYKSDTDWAEFLHRLQFRTQRFIDISHTPCLVEGFRFTVLEDEVAFQGATISMIREHFTKWTETAVEEEQGPGARPRHAQRYRYCLQVDEEALESVVRKSPGTDKPYEQNQEGYVKLINKEWEPYDPFITEDGMQFLTEDPEEPVEGCTLYDVGWMQVSYERVISVFDFLRGPHGWDVEYRRPPKLWLR